MIIDEYCFYKLCQNFPDYSTTPQWFFEDRPEVRLNSIDWDDAGMDVQEAFNLVYDTPIYTHTPMVVMAMSPVVKGLNYLADQGVIKHVEDEPGLLGVTEEEAAASRAETITNILRLISIFFSGFSMYLIYLTMKHKVGTSIWLVSVPIACGLMMMAGSTFLFYWDVFMMFFFVLTLYLMEVHPNSKWKYVAACCLVNTKMFIGIAFLAPLVLKALVENWRTGWKMMLPVLSILPFYIATVVVTGEPFYLFTHYLNQTGIHNLIYTLFTPWGYFKTLISLGVPLLLLLTLPIIKYWKKYPEYVLTLILTMVYAWGTGLGRTHTSAMIYAGALVFPLVAYELKIVERMQAWLKSHVNTNSG